MSQLSLFGSEPCVVVHDAGMIEYLPDCVAPAVAARWFSILRDSVPWRGERRVMYEREVYVPRQVASFDLHDPRARLPCESPRKR